MNDKHPFFIEYCGTTDGISDGESIFEYQHNHIDSCFIRVADSQIVIRFLTKNIFADDDVELFNDLAIGVSASLSMQLNCSINGLRSSDQFLPHRDGSNARVVKTSQISWAVHGAQRSLSEVDLNTLTAHMSVSEPSLVYLSQYLFAKSQSNPVSRFTMLYNVGLQLNKDRQEDLDIAIKKYFPNCPTSKSPYTSQEETIFTRLRNELAHYRSVPFAQTQSEIEASIRDFENTITKMLRVNI
ncbi:MAG: hypothetical protein NXI26_27340 [bacterium]|nr:hypothetical protein [bacterium]